MTGTSDERGWRSFIRGDLPGWVQAVAAVILLVAILPAEYGIDPLHTGKLLGLTGISKAAEPAQAAGRATPAATGIYSAQPATYKVDSEDLALTPGDPHAINNRGAVLLAMNQTAAARRDFLAALRIDACLEEARDNLERSGGIPPDAPACAANR